MVYVKNYTWKLSEIIFRLDVNFLNQNREFRSENKHSNQIDRDSAIHVISCRCERIEAILNHLYS